MNFTSRMAALLGQMNRQRNGAVADSMRFRGLSCGLNYGVSLPTVRQIARTEAPDHDFARYLFLQDVRELRLAALHIAEPERLVSAEFQGWADGIINSELAEEAAFAFLSRSSALPELFRSWIDSSDPLLAYAALQAAARSPHALVEWVGPVLEVVHRWAQTAASAEIDPSCEPSSLLENPVAGARIATASAAHLLAQGAVAFLAALGGKNEEKRQAVIRAADSLGKLPSEDYVHEELAWRLEA